MLNSLKQRIFGLPRRAGGASGARARNRLQFVLVQDRSGLTGEEMARLREELLGVMERYFVIDKAGFDISYKRETQSTMLLINSPVVVRRQERMGGKVGAKHPPLSPKEEKGAVGTEKAVANADSP